MLLFLLCAYKLLLLRQRNHQKTKTRKEALRVSSKKAKIVENAVTSYTKLSEVRISINEVVSSSRIFLPFGKVYSKISCNSRAKLPEGQALF